jgi:hypothetical protein
MIEGYLLMAEIRHVVEITKADWRLDLGRDDKTFGLQIVYRNIAGGWDGSLEFYGEAGQLTMIELGAKKTQDLSGKNIVIKEDGYGYFCYVGPHVPTSNSPSSSYSYETVQDGYVIFDAIGKRVEPWNLVKILDKVLELSGTL